MKKCKHCQSEIDAKAKVCPNCGKKQGMAAWLKVLIVILVLGLFGAALSDKDTTTSDNGSDSKEKKETQTTVKKDNLELEEGHSGAPDSAGVFYYIEGYIKNNTDKDYSYVQATFTAYDNEGNTLGTCLDNNSGLEANGRWKFKAICTDAGDSKKIASYKLKEITGY